MAKPRKGKEDTDLAPAAGASSKAPRRTRRVSTTAGVRAAAGDRAGLTERAAALEPPGARLTAAGVRRRTGRDQSPPASTGSSHEPVHAEIAQRAYEIYIRRGGAPGNPADDWFEAERELRRSRASTPGDR
jgi:hypothetical protein